MLTQAYVPHKVDAPDHVSVETGEWIRDTDQDSLLNKVVMRGSPTDFVSCGDLLQAATEAGMEVSKVKLGRLMYKKFGIKSKNKGGEAGRGFEGVSLVCDT